jgi:hypothetical protein
MSDALRKGSFQMRPTLNIGAGVLERSELPTVEIDIIADYSHCIEMLAKYPDSGANETQYALELYHLRLNKTSGGMGGWAKSSIDGSGMALADENTWNRSLAGILTCHSRRTYTVQLGGPS